MSLSEAHLLKLETYVSKYLFNKPGAQCIRNELLSKCLDDRRDENVIQRNRTCPHCFNMWHEGHFSIKTKSNRTGKSNSKKSITIKCFICNKCCVIERSSVKPRLVRKESGVRKSNHSRTRGGSKEGMSTKRKRRKLRIVSKPNPNLGPKSRVKNVNQKKVALDVLNDLL